MIHRRGGCHGAGVKGLHLVRTKAVALEPKRQVHHVFIAGAGVRRNEIGNEKLFFASFGAVLVKHLFELVVAANARLHHF